MEAQAWDVDWPMSWFDFASFSLKVQCIGTMGGMQTTVQVGMHVEREGRPSRSAGVSVVHASGFLAKRGGCRDSKVALDKVRQLVANERRHMYRREEFRKAQALEKGPES